MVFQSKLHLNLVFDLAVSCERFIEKIIRRRSDDPIICTIRKALHQRTAICFTIKRSEIWNTASNNTDI